MKLHGLKISLMILLAIAGFSVIVMLLWNALLPSIFGIVTINFWQATGILALARILFGGLNGGCFGHRRMMDKNRNHIREKWMKMTPEERKKFMQVHKDRMHHHRDFFGRGFDDRFREVFEEKENPPKDNVQ